VRFFSIFLLFPLSYFHLFPLVLITYLPALKLSPSRNERKKMHAEHESKLTHPIRVLSAEISMAEVLHWKSLWMGDQSRLSPAKG
jgi:hypothetical protein